MRAFTATVLLGCAAATLAGCGLRGPLYLPEDKARTESEAATPADPASSKEQVLSPQPAAQAQKRDRPASVTDPAPATPAN